MAEARNSAEAARARRGYEDARRSLFNLIKDRSPEEQSRALKRFDTDPRIQNIRKLAGFTPVETRQQAVRETARREVARQRAQPSAIPETLRDMGASLIGSGNDALLGIPARAAAALTGTPNDVMQAFADEQGQRAPVTNILGTLAGSLATGGALAGGAKALGARLASTAAPIAQRAGQLIESATTLRKGQRLKNVARVGGAGATAGATDAAIKDRSVAGGAALGTAGALGLHGAIQGAGAVYRGARNLAGFEPVEELLSKYVKTPVEEIQRRLQARTDRGLESSVYEVLPLADRQALDDAIGKMPANSREGLATAVRQRTANMVQETSNQVQTLTQPQLRQARDDLASDLAASRGGGAPTPVEVEQAARAIRSPLDMETVAAAEARNIMRPFDDMDAFEGVSSLFPQHPINRGSEVVMVESSPEISGMISRAAGLLRSKTDPLTVREVTDILSRLRRRVNGEEGDIAREAIDHITDLLERERPEIAEAVGRMRSQWHRRLTMMEGMTEGARGRLRENAPANQQVRNAYDTGGGQAGRSMGQAAQLERDLELAPDASLRAINDIAANPTAQRAISQNLSEGVGEEIADVARTQSESARSLGRLASERGGDPQMDGAHLLQNLMMLAPNTLPSTKAIALSRLTQGSFRIPERQANELVEMLFSQNPTQISRAIRTLQEQGGQDAIRLIGRDLAVGAMSSTGATPNDAPDIVAGSAAPDMSEPDYSQMSDEELMGLVEQEGQDYSQMSDEELMQLIEEGGDSPYVQDLQIIYDTESPELLDLISRVASQESQNRHFGADGRPTTSPAGAIGVMQVMPGTAPEAAAMAGVPWDENAYRNDPVYNRILGIAYLSEMLRRYDGDVELALAAYNAGPGRADEYKSGKRGLPAETQEYIARIAG